VIFRVYVNLPKGNYGDFHIPNGIGFRRTIRVFEGLPGWGEATWNLGPEAGQTVKQAWQSLRNLR
jgi:hypothetical protein